MHDISCIHDYSSNLNWCILHVQMHTCAFTMCNILYYMCITY